MSAEQIKKKAQNWSTGEFIYGGDGMRMVDSGELTIAWTDHTRKRRRIVVKGDHLKVREVKA